MWQNTGSIGWTRDRCSSSCSACCRCPCGASYRSGLPLVTLTGIHHRTHCLRVCSGWCLLQLSVAAVEALSSTCVMVVFVADVVCGLAIADHPCGRGCVPCAEAEGGVPEPHLRTPGRAVRGRVGHDRRAVAVQRRCWPHDAALPKPCCGMCRRGVGVSFLSAFRCNPSIEVPRRLWRGWRFRSL